MRGAGAGDTSAAAKTAHLTLNRTARICLLSVVQAKDLLYVGDEHRVQEFEAASGKWVGEIPLTSLSEEQESEVQALALDQETGDLYLNYAGLA